MRRLACCVVLTLCAPAGADDSTLFPIVQDGKWGYVDRAGQVAIPPRFDRAERFSEGLGAVQLGRTFGYVDRTGQMVLVPGYAPAGTLHRRFSSGLAPVRVGNRYGYIDRTGKLAIPARYTGAEDFSEGYAMACLPTGCGYIDAQGRGVITPEFMGSRPVRGGIACANLAMSMGRERVVLFAVPGRRIPGEFGGCVPSPEGLVAVKVRGLWGYTDATGAPIIPPRYSWAGEFAGGLAPVREGRELCGYVDRSGAYVIPPAFRECAPFSEGLARVDLARESTDAGRVAFIDRSGTPVIVGSDLHPRFDDAEDFRDGLAVVGVGGPPHLAGAGGPMLGYVDAAGRWIWKPTR
jgi:hypothetical protein